jgi:hypothetical protein
LRRGGDEAKALGIEIPKAILFRADGIIE